MCTTPRVTLGCTRVGAPGGPRPGPRVLGRGPAGGVVGRGRPPYVRQHARRAGATGPVRRDQAVRRRPRHRVTLRAMTRGDLPDVTRWRAAEHVSKWWASDGEPTVGERRGQVRPRHRRHHPDPDVGGRGQRPLDRVRAGLPDRRLPRVRACSARTRRRSASTTRSASPAGSAAASAYDCSGPGCCGPAPASPTPGRTSRRRTTATPPRMPDPRKAGFTEGVWFDEPQEDGTVDTVVGCTLDVATVVG